MSELREVIGGTKTKVYFHRHEPLQRYRPSNWVWLRLEIKQNQWRVLKKSCISY